MDEAQRLLPILPITADEHALAQELHVRIQAARLQVQTLRLGRDRSSAIEVHPKWIEADPWEESSPGDGQSPWGRSPPPENISR